MDMKKKDLNRMISLIDDEKLSESEKYRKRRISPIKITAMVACCAVIISSAATLAYFKLKPGEKPVEPVDSNGIQIISTEPTSYTSDNFIANDTEFIVKTKNGTIEELEKCLYLDPPVDYTLKETAKDEFVVTPATAMPDNTVVNIARIENKRVAQSWAYQTKKELTVSETYPRDGVVSASTNTAIEIVLSFADVENFGDYVTFSPEIDGEWTHDGRLWRFIPSKPLEKDAHYDVFVRKGYSSGDIVGSENYKFSFETFEALDADETKITYTPINITADRIFSFLPDEDIVIPFVPMKGTHADITRISLAKIESADEFMTAVSAGGTYDAKDGGDVPFTWQKLSDTEGKDEDSIVFDEKLEEGYYQAKLYDSRGIMRCSVNIQVNRISAYAFETEDEVVIWAAKDRALAEGLTVLYDGSSTATDKDGVARFNVSDESGMRYAEIKSEGSNTPLIIGFEPFSGENISGYVYTDRSTYRTDDTAYIWGVVPPEMIPENAVFTLEIYHGTTEKTVNVKLDEFGCFKAEYDIGDSAADSITFTLFCNDRYVARRWAQIKNFVRQYYDYDIKLQKNYYTVGDTVEFDVAVKHLTGIVPEGKRVTATMGQKTETGFTDENGTVHFSMTIDEDDFYKFETESYSKISVSVQNGDGIEFSEAYTSEPIYVFYRNIAVVYSQSAAENMLNIKVYDLDIDKEGVVLEDYEPYEDVYEKFGSPSVGRSVTVTLMEKCEEEQVVSYQFDEYTKLNVPNYSTVTIYEKPVKIWTEKTVNGEVNVDFGGLEYKTSDDSHVSYCYWILLEVETDDGVYMIDKLLDPSVAIRPGSVYRSIQKNYINGIDLNYLQYITFRYRFDVAEGEEYAGGDDVNVTLQSIDKNISGGSVLRILFDEKITAADTVPSDKISFKYPETTAAGAHLAGAYFKDGVFHRIPSAYLKASSENKELKVDVVSDKDEYAPGDDVTLDIEVKDFTGEGERAEVLISIVNEAAFLDNDDTPILSELNRKLDYSYYYVSTSFDAALSRDDTGFGGGGGDLYRGDFGDNAFFDSVVTDSDGKARVTFTLPDTVTKYRVCAQAVNGMNAGVSKTSLDAKLDFFIQHTEPENIKPTDDYVAAACAIGGGETTEFNFTIKETGDEKKVTAEHSHMVYANFGKLDAGEYTVQISAESEGKTDSVEYTAKVVTSVQRIGLAKKYDVGSGKIVAKGDTVVEICSAEMTKYMEYLDYLQKTLNSRLDTQIAYREATVMKNELLGENAYVPYIRWGDYTVRNTDGYIVAMLPDAKPDGMFAALAAYYSDPQSFSRGSVRDFDEYEKALISAAERQPVLDDLAYLAENAEDAREKLIVSLAYSFLGDYEGARKNYAEAPDKETESLQALAATFIDRDNAAAIIDGIIEDRPQDKYVRFAVLSYLRNYICELNKEESVSIKVDGSEEVYTVKGFEVKRIELTAKQINSAVFKELSDNIDITYYYSTPPVGEDVYRDLTVSLNEEYDGAEDEYTLDIDFTRFEGYRGFGCITVVLPGNIRMRDGQKTETGWTAINRTDKIVIYTSSRTPQEISIPVYKTYDGEFGFEPVVMHTDDEYHISDSFVFGEND